MVTVYSSYFWPAVTTVPNTNNLRSLFWPVGSETLVLGGGSIWLREHVAGTPHRAEKNRVGTEGWAATITGPV